MLRRSKVGRGWPQDVVDWRRSSAVSRRLSYGSPLRIRCCHRSMRRGMDNHGWHVRRDDVVDIRRKYDLFSGSTDMKWFDCSGPKEPVFLYWILGTLWLHYQWRMVLEEETNQRPVSSKQAKVWEFVGVARTLKQSICSFERQISTHQRTTTRHQQLLALSQIDVHFRCTALSSFVITKDERTAIVLIQALTLSA